MATLGMKALREKFAPGPGFELRSPALRAGALPHTPDQL